MNELDSLADLVAKACRLGASAADALRVDGASVSVGMRLGALERLERAEGSDIGLRVFFGHRQAAVSSSDVSLRALDELVERAVAMAKAAPEDPFCGIAEPDAIARRFPELDLAGGEEISAETLTDWARRAEDAARAVPGVTNSEGADASWSRSRVILAASNGFTGSYTVGRAGLSASVLAGTGTAMERDYDFTSAVHADELRGPEDVGRGAGERAVRRLNPRKVKSAQVPMVYDPRVSAGLVGHLAGAINGASVARGTSFLKDRLGQKVLSAGLNVVDDPFRQRGLRSRPFDSEGLAGQRRQVVADGVLTGWILDLRSARQLGLASTGNGTRGTGGPPGPSVSNFYLEPGAVPPQALIGAIDQGFYITELLGMGVNGVTGDYSRGAAGFWIEGGQLAHPVSEVTIAGNLKDMFLNLTAANDLVFRYGTDAPTLRVDGMTLAGA